MTLVLNGIADGQKLADVARMFGGKAAGFNTIPAAWRPPAMFIGEELYNSFLAGDQSFLNTTGEAWPTLSALGKKLGNELIIRSSATDESISERGQFKSKIIRSDATTTEFCDMVREIFTHYRQIGRNSMCLIAQCYVHAIETGFLSNELRLVDKPYRWVVERHLPSAVDNVPVKSLSAKQAREISTTEPLICLSRQELLSRIRSAARHFWKTSPSQRLLLEWCWDGSKLWIVQKDYANPGTQGRDPS